MNDSTSSVWDQEAVFFRATVVGGGDEALGPLLQSFRAYLLTVAGQELDAELHGKCGASDVVQETFCEAHGDWKSFRGTSISELRAWLRRILLNNIRDLTRAYGQTKRDTGREIPCRRDLLDGMVDPELTPRAHASAQEEAIVVARAIQRLPDDHQRVIELRSRENLSFQDIGLLMGRSPDAVRMLWFRAIENLRRQLVARDAT